MSEDIDVSKLSLEDRCTHKAWKVRLDGYEEILKLFAKCDDSPKGNDFNKYGGLLKNFVSETNVVAQEKGLEAVLCLLQNAHPSIATKYIYDIVPNLIAKCFTTKPKAKQLATDCLLQCIELEKQEYVIEELIKGLTNKTPKVVIGSLDVLKEAIKGFGPKIITVKPILKQVPTLLDHRDSNIRLETKQLIKTVYQWLGDVIKPALQGLKPIHLQELELMFSTVLTENDRITKQTLWTRTQKAQMLAAATAAVSMDGGPTSQNSSVNPGVITDSQTVCDTEIDPFDLIEAVDVLSALPRKFYDEIADKSWQVRKQALESLKDILAPPKYESNGDYHELVKTLRTCIAKDTNILAVILAAENLTRLAMGLRKKFGSMAQSCVSAILEKFKEKKPTVITALRAAIDAIYPTTTFDNIAEDVIAAIGNKNPAVRNETMSFLHRIFTTYPDMAYVALTNPTQPSTKKLLKTLVTTLITASSDSDPHVRESTIETLADLLKIGGDKVMLPLLSDLDKTKLDKVKELSEKSEIKLKPIIPQAVGQHNNINAASRTKNQEFEPTSSAILQKGFDIDINNENGGGGVLDSNSTNMGKPKKMIRKTTFKAAHSGLQKKKIGSSIMANNGATVSNSKSVDSINDAAATEQYNHHNNIDNTDHHNNKNMNKIIGTMKSKSNPNKGGISTNNRISMSISNLAKKAGGISPPSTQTGTAVDNNVNEPSSVLLSNNATINLANNLFNANATRQAKMGRLKAWKPIASSWLNGIVNSGSIGGIGSSGGGGPMSGGGSAGGGGCGPGSGPGGGSGANASARALGEAATSLRDVMEPLLGNSVVKSCLFHKDFRYQIKGMDTLNQCLTEILNAIHRPIPNNEENNGYSGQSIIDFETGVNCFERIFVGSDLLIRWCIIRLCDSSNPALMLKCLDFLTHLFEILHVLQQQQRQLNNDNGVTASSCPSLNDTEVTCLATVITVRCFGDKDLVRKAGRLAFQSLAQVVCTNNSSSPTTAGKLIWSAGLDILKTTKNAKQKQDMLEEMTNMLKTYHVNQILACSTSSSMFIATIKTVGPVLNDRIVLRNCAFNLFAALFNQCGDVVFKHLSSSETFSNTHVTAMLALENKIRKIAASTPSFVNSPPIDSTTNINNTMMTTLNTNNVGTQNVNEINHGGVMAKTKTPISNSRLSMPSKILQSSDMLSQTPPTAYNNNMDDLATISQNQFNTNTNNTQFMNQFPPQLNNNNILTTSLISPQARRSYVKNVLNSLVSQQHMVNSPARQTNLTLQDGLSTTPHKLMATNIVQTPKLPMIDVTKQGLANLRLYDTSEADNILAEPVIFPAAFKRTPPTAVSNHSQYTCGGGSSVSSMMMENTTTEFSSKNPSLSSPALPGIKSEHSQLIKQNGIHQLCTTTNTFDTNNNKSIDNINVILNQPCSLHSISMYEQLHALTLSWYNNSTLLNEEESSGGRMVKNEKIDFTHCMKAIESTEIWMFGQRQAQTTHHHNTAANENAKGEMKCTCWELNGAKLFSTTLIAITLSLKACYGKIFGDTTPTHKDVNKPLTDLADAYIQDCTRILNFLLHFMAIPLTPLSYHDTKNKTVIWLGNRDQMKELLDALLIILSKASSTVAFMKTYNLVNNDNTVPYNNLNALVRKLNIILVKIIEMSAFGPILSALLSLFIGAVECVLAFETNAENINDNINDVVHKNFILQKDTKQQYMGLIMKCIWKAIKLLPLSMSSLLSTYNRGDLSNNNVSKTQTYLYDILKQCDIFMTKYPTSLWKKRLTSQQYQQQHNSNTHENEHNPSNNSNATGNGDTPMRTIKTLVHSLTMLCGTCILDYISSHPLNTAHNDNGQETYVFSSELHMYITKVLRVITAPSVTQTNNATIINNNTNTPAKNEIHNNNLPIDNCIAPQNDGKSSSNNVFYSPPHEQGKQKLKLSVEGTTNHHNSEWPPQCLTLSSNHDRNTIQAILNEFDRGNPATFESSIHALHEFGAQRPNFDLRNYVWIHVPNILLRDAILHALATYDNNHWEKCEAYHTYFTCQPTQPNVTKATSLKYFEKHWGGIMGGHQKFLQVLAPSSLQSNAAKFPSLTTNDAANKKQREILSTEACKQKINQHLTFLDNLPGEWKMSAGQN